jgi:hypothetical protein
MHPPDPALHPRSEFLGRDRKRRGWSPPERLAENVERDREDRIGLELGREIPEVTLLVDVLEGL